MNEPFIIMSAPNGARRQKSDHPALPITPDDMALCAELILSQGASILHLHVRDEFGGHSLDVDRYRASITAIRDAVGDELIIQATTESVGIYNRHQQMEMVKSLKPEATSLALRELCPTEDDVLEFSEFTKWINQEHIFPQYILYNQYDYDRFEIYRKQGIFHDDNPFVLFVLGSYTATDEAATEKLKQTTLQAKFPWAVCGFDTNEKNSVIHAAKNNGHIRVGFENNLWRTENELLQDSGEMIRYSAKIAALEKRSVATATMIRNIFNLRD
ncbi:MAG: 3-keto-5-aminohexanoate cleavage protein [Kordiimonadaceae bacterium]|jgi:3-keto-5-aminohexanoate cleavage enzyme|nr:3-keto-5-aminohexanoate cleavage protein [Kordiimonadaceae bacterium]MBT6031080.1 3-keto-5-aminohexanoate cleavage protein [Kordiimonadaceae bacterium]